MVEDHNQSSCYFPLYLVESILTPAPTSNHKVVSGSNVIVIFTALKLRKCTIEIIEK